MTISLTQFSVLAFYFVFIYGAKGVLDSFSDSKPARILRALIPAFNLIFGLVLGATGLAQFDMTAAVLGALSTGGAAGLLQLPSKIIQSQQPHDAADDATKR